MLENSASEGLRALLRGGLPDLGPGPRAGTVPSRELDSALAKLLPESGLSAAAAALARAVILLWHDRLDAAHTIAQGIPDPDGSFLHGIVHRREPDYANAKYWFHRVGAHPSLSQIAAQVSAFLTAKNAGALGRRLTADGQWNAIGFVELCAAPGAQTEWLRQIQAIELRVLLERFLKKDHFP